MLGSCCKNTCCTHLDREERTRKLSAQPEIIKACELILLSVAGAYTNISIPPSPHLDGLLVHRRFPFHACNIVASTDLYIWVKRVKNLV